MPSHLGIEFRRVACGVRLLSAGSMCSKEVTHLDGSPVEATERFSRFVRPMRGLWLPGLPLYYRSASAFQALGPRHLPELWAHLSRCGISSELLATGILLGEWLSLFSRWLPFSELWTVFQFVEMEHLPGLLSFTLALLQAHTAVLLEDAEFCAVFEKLRDLAGQRPQPKLRKVLESAKGLLLEARTALSAVDDEDTEPMPLREEDDTTTVGRFSVTRSDSGMLHFGGGSDIDMEVVVTTTSARVFSERMLTHCLSLQCVRDDDSSSMASESRPSPGHAAGSPSSCGLCSRQGAKRGASAPGMRQKLQTWFAIAPPQWLPRFAGGRRLLSTSK